MIIDAHCHLWQRDMIPEKFWRASAKMISQMFPGSPSIETILGSELMQKAMNGSPERLITEMNEAAIDKTIVFGNDWGLVLGEAKIPINGYNKYIADSAREYSDRLIAYFTIDPRRPKAAESFETALTKWEMQGLKLHPSTGFLPDDESCYKLYEVANQYQVPIITHSGYIVGLKGRTARPEYFDGPTTDFPDLRFSFAHLNAGSIDDLMSLMGAKINVYCDISGYGQTTITNSPPDFYRKLRFMMNEESCANRVMFGSDWPYLSVLMSLSKWVGLIKNLKEQKVTDILEKFGYHKFKSKEISQILGKNAQNFLNLKT
ncbi:MAG: amidohydrolase family protein [Candidatus Helarchaeota archaeon]